MDPCDQFGHTAKATAAVFDDPNRDQLTPQPPCRLDDHDVEHHWQRGQATFYAQRTSHARKTRQDQLPEPIGGSRLRSPSDAPALGLPPCSSRDRVHQVRQLRGEIGRPLMKSRAHYYVGPVNTRGAR